MKEILVIMIITFCGHSQVIFTDEEKSVLRNILVDEINKKEDE